MKTTVEIPDPLFREAKAAAVARGQSFKQLMNEALREKLSRPAPLTKPQRWMRLFGSMKAHSAELRRIDAVIEEEFESVEPEE